VDLKREREREKLNEDRRICTPKISQLLFFIGYYESKIMRWAGTVACIGKMKFVHNILPARPET
jgi:hypothetical protein